MKALLLQAAHHGVAQVLGTILFLAGAGIGCSMILSPHTYSGFWALSENFHWVSVPAWGTLFMFASILLVVTVWVDTEHAQLPALVLGTIFIAFGLLSLLSGVSMVVFVFNALGWVSVFTQIVCWAKEKQRETVLHSHQPR